MYRIILEIIKISKPLSWNVSEKFLIVEDNQNSVGEILVIYIMGNKQSQLFDRSCRRVLDTHVYHDAIYIYTYNDNTSETVLPLTENRLYRWRKYRGENWHWHVVVIFPRVRCSFIFNQTDRRLDERSRVNYGGIANTSSFIMSFVSGKMHKTKK